MTQKQRDGCKPQRVSGYVFTRNKNTEREILFAEKVIRSTNTIKVLCATLDKILNFKSLKNFKCWLEVFILRNWYKEVHIHKSWYKKVDILCEYFKNIFHNVIWDRVINCYYRQPPWMTDVVKSKLSLIVFFHNNGFRCKILVYHHFA